MGATTITRHFATIRDGRWGARQVHYRHVGSGPVVLCLHQSPLSSRDMIPAMRRWAKKFTCIAPDTPGYGLSDPFGVDRAEMTDIADAVIEFMDALGIEKAAAYGFHTGAMIAAALAHGHPDRIVCSASNGYVVLTEQDRADIVANYLPPIVPSWDGAHLTWLWARLREQTIFFPWYRKTLADRMNLDVPAPEALQEALLDFMRSGDPYRVGYRAAFTMPSHVAPREMKVPALFTASQLDPLVTQLPRITHVSPTVTVQASGSFEDAIDFCGQFIAKHRPPKPPKLAAPAPLAGRLWHDYVTVDGGQLRVKRSTEATGRPVIVQHDAAGSSDIVAHLARGFVGRRPVIALDLPGNGESDDVLPKGRLTVTAHARVVLKALDALGVEDFDFVGTWGGGLVGLELALMAPSRVKHLVLADMLYFDDALRAELRANYTPDIQPNWYGGHLLEAWHLMRDQGLFWPWYNRKRAGIIRKPLFIDPVMINQRVLDLFKSKGRWRDAYQAHFAYPLQSKLRQATRQGKVPMRFVAPSWDPQLEVTQQAARDFPQAAFQLMPDDMSKWGEALMPFLGE